MYIKKHNLKLPNDVHTILNILQKHGQGFLVGGSVRDLLLGLEPKDYDFCTDIEYDKLKDIFKEYKPKEIGRHFGIIQINVNGVDYEIAKFRVDIGTPNDRRQQEIQFTNNLEDDLKRRDFTCNAIAYDGENIHTIDVSFYLDVVSSISKELRFVGDIKQRIYEDPLRLWRMVRFACTKPFNKIPSNIRAYFDDKSFYDLMDSLSMERIRDEFTKILTSNNVRQGLKLLVELGLIDYIIPNYKDLQLEQHNEHHNKNVWKHICAVVESIEPKLELRLSALLHDIGKPQTFTLENGVGHFYGHEVVSCDMARDILTKLKYPNSVIDTVCTLVMNHMNKSHRQSKKAMRKLINRVGVDNMQLLFKLLEADIIGSKPPYNFDLLDNMKILYHEIMKEEKEAPILSLKDLKVNGYDMINLGLKGKQIGDMLNYIHEYVLSSGDNNRNVLLEMAKERMKNEEI